jgi:hypothetical protein
MKETPVPQSFLRRSSERTAIMRDVPGAANARHEQAMDRCAACRAVHEKIFPPVGSIGRCGGEKSRRDARISAGDSQRATGSARFERVEKLRERLSHAMLTRRACA